MQKHKWLKRVLIITLAPMVVIGGLVAWSFAKYGPNPIIPHKRVTITLPYRPENELKNLIPMGETIEHNFKGGHPGIDFQWDYPAPLIAVADGKVTSITQADDKGTPVTYLELTSGEYVARYKELDKIEDGIKVGSVVKQGDVLGYPHCTSFDGRAHCQLHWEFTYSSPLAMMAGASSGIDRLCPMTYFDADAQARINAAWANVPATDKFKKDFPHICSGGYLGHDQ